MPDLRVYLTADGRSVTASRGGGPLVDGVIGPIRGGWQAALHALGPVRDPEAEAAVLLHLAELAGRLDGLPLRWLVSDPGADDDAAARQAGLSAQRDLLQMRCELPLSAEARAGLPEIHTRPFRPGLDEDGWLAVNNRAFADHPDQSNQSAADLAALEAEPWFDPEGFRLLGDAELDGFCWTRVHTGPPDLGEIFVIGVDPSAHGRRLGPALTVAGLDHLAGRGISMGMLYVDLSNQHALAMYRKLGFTTHHVDRIYG